MNLKKGYLNFESAISDKLTNEGILFKGFFVWRFFL